MKRKKGKKFNNALLVYVLLGVVTCMVAGYALLSDTLSFSSTVNASADFNVDFVNGGASVTSSAGLSGTPTFDYATDDTLTISGINLIYPGAYLEVTAPVKNNSGSLKAKLTATPTITTGAPYATDIVGTLGATNEMIANNILDESAGVDATDNLVIRITFSSGSVATTVTGASVTTTLNFEQYTP